MNAMHVSAAMPPDLLELKAAEQRRRIHHSVLELRSRLGESLDVRKHASEYVWTASGAAALLGLLAGWGVAALFSAPNT